MNRYRKDNTPNYCGDFDCLAGEVRAGYFAFVRLLMYFLCRFTLPPVISGRKNVYFH